MIKDKASLLFIALGFIFITNTLIAEFIGMKVFSLEDTLGIKTINWSLFGASGSLQFSAGVIIWPVVFILTDVINEYFGKRGVRYLSFFTMFLIAYCFLVLYFAIHLDPADWWVTQNESKGMPNMQFAFQFIFGQGSIMIVASILAFIVGQLIDAYVFSWIKKATGQKKVWLRANGSTAISQLVDSFIVLYIAFVLGPSITGQFEPWPMHQFWAVGIINYSYKLLAAIVLTPLIYLTHRIIDRYLGPELAARLRSKHVE